MIWCTQEESDVKEFIKKNVLFVGMLLGIGFLITVSLVASAAVAGLGKFLEGFLPAPWNWFFYRLLISPFRSA